MPTPKAERVTPSPFNNRTAARLKKLVDTELKSANDTIEILAHKIATDGWCIGDEIDLTVSQEKRYLLNRIKSHLELLGFYD